MCLFTPLAHREGPGASLYHAVVRLTHILVDGDGAYRVGNDVSAGGILDILDMSADVGLHVRIFKDTVAVGSEGTVLDHQVVGIAEELLACQLAVHQPYVLRVPSQILAVEVGVADSDILALPEGVFRHDVGIDEFHVLTVLEHIFRIAFQTVYLHILAEHEGIGAVVEFQVAGLDIAATPESLVGIVDDHILQVEVVHLAEELRGIDTGVAHVHVIAVPDGRAGTDIELAAVDLKPMDMPEGVLTPETAVLGLNVRALLDGTLAFADGHLLQPRVMGLKERTLAFKMLLSDYFHTKTNFCFLIFLGCKGSKKFQVYE